MKARLFTIFGFLYVIFAFTTAYSALAPTETSVTNCSTSRVEVERLERAIFNSESVDFVDETVNIDVSKEFFIRIWVSDNCRYCEKFKKTELPKLKKAGIGYTILNASKIRPPKDIKYTPTFKVYRRDKLLKTYVGYVKAETLINLVKAPVPLIK